MAGFLAGLLGIGGGLVIVPALYLWLAPAYPEHAIHVAVATSLATIVFTAASSVYAHHRHGAVDWPMAGRLVPGLILGALAGAAVASWLAGALLTAVFGVFCLLAGTRMLAAAAAAVPAGVHRPGGAATTAAGLGIGAVSAIVGIGGGTLTVPYLTLRGVDMHAAVATSAACGLPIAVAGVGGFIGMGLEAAGVPPHSLGFVWGPAVAGIAAAGVVAAPLGARTAHRSTRAALRRVFGCFLVLLGCYFVARVTLAA